MNENNVVAIDFGTSRTKLAYFDPKTEKVELMRHGVENYLPSYFAVDKDGKILLGYDAQKMVESGYPEAVSNIKGQISELSIKSWFFQRLEKTPQELLTALFTYLRKEAGKKRSTSETEPQRAYLTHPTTFSEDDKEILKNAAQNAGFSVELIEEPVAAAEFVGMSRRDLPTDLIILDCGAGTLHWTYMAREYIYGDEPKHIIKPNIKPGGTITGIPDGEDETKALVGGSFIEWSLADTLKKRIGSITEDDFELLRHELMVRKELFCRSPNPDDEIPPIEIRDFSVSVNGREMKAAIEANYIRPACNVVAPYIKKVIDVTKGEGRKPALLLTGGCAQIKDFKVALEEKFGLECIVTSEYEYATVCGALALSEEIRSKLSEQSEGTETTESEETEIRNKSIKTEMLNKSIEEKFHEFGNEIGDTLANDAMSCLIALVDYESEGGIIDIGGADHNYLRDSVKGNSLIGSDHEEIKQNIISYFVDHLFLNYQYKLSQDKLILIFQGLDNFEYTPGQYKSIFQMLNEKGLNEKEIIDSVYQDMAIFQGLNEKKIIDSFRSEVNTLIKKSYGEALLEAIPSRAQVLLICERCVRENVPNILDNILAEIDIKATIKDAVESHQIARIVFSWVIIEPILVRKNRRIKSRKTHAKQDICKILKVQLEQSRNTHEAQIRDAVIEVLRSTAEELCQQLTDAPDRIKSSTS